MKFLTSLKFKLALWYSSFMLIFCAIFVLFANILLAEQLQNSPAEPPAILFTRNRPMLQERWEKLDEERKELIQEYREEDLENFRKLSLFTLLPLTALSFLGGYLIAEQSLRPLKKLNEQISKINTENLNAQIKHEDNGDEISELIRNFNTMTNRLDKSFQAQRQFVEDASHELKTPLAIIQTNLDAAKIDKKISTGEVTELIETAQKSGEFMNKLIEDLLLLAILENDMEFKTLDLEKLLKNSISTAKTEAKKKNIKIKFAKTGKQFKFKGNETLLQRAFSNLLENAVKYSQNNTTITLNQKFQSSKLKISITDQGPGVSKSEQKKIFERFYRIDKSRSRKTGGTGLGLSIVKKIVEAHKGKISVESKAKKGTIFTITLPLK